SRSLCHPWACPVSRQTWGLRKHLLLSVVELGRVSAKAVPQLVSRGPASKTQITGHPSSSFDHIENAARGQSFRNGGN
ncbi:hypothetical protein BJY52DRAFT_1274555, partial [Lactarius psammicola]